MPRSVLVQLDCDPSPSTFDAIVAVDAGVDVLLRHGGVTPENVRPLVHGAMFTRGGEDLRSTAIFVGGSDVRRAEAVRDAILETFFGPVRVGVMLDPSGANTTAAAAVLAAARHLPLDGARGIVLGGTGPVGQRVARLLAGKGAFVGVASRSLSRAAEACEAMLAAMPSARVRPLAGEEVVAALAEADVVVAAGAAGTRLLALEEIRAARGESGRKGPSSGPDAPSDRPLVLVDLNAVPPSGIEGIGPADKAARVEGLDAAVVAYGPIGVGGLKMKIHRRAISALFESTTAAFDAEQLLAVGEALEAAPKR
jgi:hypothetical protein